MKAGVRYVIRTFRNTRGIYHGRSCAVWLGKSYGSTRAEHISDNLIHIVLSHVCSINRVDIHNVRVVIDYYL